MTEDATQERKVCGRGASAGLLDGVLVTAPQTPPGQREAGTPAEERAALRAALGRAVGQLTELMAKVDDTETSGILAFQVALLEDEHLSQPAFERIDAGEPAEQAFAWVMTDMVREYQRGADEYFAARASDLEDLCERVIQGLCGQGTAVFELPDGAILLADDLSPSRFLAMDWSGERGIALRWGSASAHVAMLARSRQVPMVVGLGELQAVMGTPALLDGEAGSLMLYPTAHTRAVFMDRQHHQRDERVAESRLAFQPAVTLDGEIVEVQLNISDVGELDRLDPSLASGIGLVRTEFLFHGRRGLPGEVEQLAMYRQILQWAGDRPVTIRTLDAGGDKPISGMTLLGENNPALGLRGIRLCLAREEIFRVQLRALLRAAGSGNLRIMIPMVSVPREMHAVQQLLLSVAEELRSEGRPVGHYQLGMMVEVPSTALTLDSFDCDFVSIGSNDLLQYLLAAGRDSGVIELLDPCEPALLRIVSMVVEQAARQNIALSLCGDAGADPQVLPWLLATGLRSVSVAPSAVGRVKRIIAGWSRHD